MRIGLSLLLVLSASAGCGGDDPDHADAGPLPIEFGGDRPVTLHVPADYDPARSYPLLLVLHGAGINGATQLDYVGFARLVDERDTLLLAPDGTMTGSSTRWWDFIGDDVDDLGYLSGLIDEVSGHYNVDADRVFAFGHSNGAAMAHVIACNRSYQFAAILSLAHGVRKGVACQPVQPVSVLQLHGDADQVVPYTGLPIILGAVESVETWARRDGCETARDTLPEPLDVDGNVDGAETRVERTRGCPTGIDVELWTMVGGSHVPALGPGFADLVWAWFAAHAKPWYTADGVVAPRPVTP